MRTLELMTKPAISCNGSDSLNTAAGLMWDHDIGAVPITNDQGKLIGILTDRDICMATYTQGRPLHAIPVSQVMSKEVFSCSGGDTVEAAERLMADKQIRRVPIVDGEGRPMGMLSLNDIARRAASPKQRSAGGEHEVVETLAAVSRPRFVAEAFR